jgi:hypothetical protein
MTGVLLAAAFVLLVVLVVVTEVNGARQRACSEEAEAARDRAIAEAIEMADLVRSLTGPSPLERSAAQADSRRPEDEKPDPMKEIQR